MFPAISSPLSGMSPLLENTCPIPGYPLVDDEPCEYLPKVLKSRFPIFCIRSERLTGPETLAPLWEYLAWSYNLMYVGTYPATGFRGSALACPGRAGMEMYKGRRFRLIEVRGDWKQHVQAFRLVHYYTGWRICHQCKASRGSNLSFCDFQARPAWKATVRSHREFLLEELGSPINMLIFTAKFHYQMIKFDSMHTVNLGCGLHANGSAWFELLKLSWFGQGDRGQLFRNAFRSFKNFTRSHQIPTSQPVFKPWMLVMSGEEYCFFATKVLVIVEISGKILDIYQVHACPGYIIPCSGLQLPSDYFLAGR